MVQEDSKIFSEQFKNYSADRKEVLLSPLGWLDMKRQMDNVHNSTSDSQRPLWRIHDKLYDFTNFKNHPGGYSFIDMTKNTDITELFESSHYNIDKASAYLEKYYVADCAKDHVRNTSNFTFKKNGFYVELRKRVNDYLSKRSTLGYFQRSTWIHDLLMVTLLSLWMVILLHPWTGNVYVLAGLETLCGLLFAMIVICAHAYFHMADNWRMYSFDLSVLSSFEWRISHVLSHHTMPNSVMDYEIAAFEPFLYFMPYSWKEYHRYWLPIQTAFVLTVVFPLVSIITALQRSVAIAVGKQSLRWEYLLSVYFFIFSVGLHFYYHTSHSTGTQITIWDSIVFVGIRFLLLQCATSFFFLHISLTGTHHQPTIWHSGDSKTFAEYAGADGTVDWGVYQIFTIGFRPALDRSWMLSTVFFGQHVLHHLFPTLDPALLQELHPILVQTCKEHKLMHLLEDDKHTNRVAKKRIFTLWEGWIGFVMQALRYQKV